MEYTLPVRANTQNNGTWTGCILNRGNGFRPGKIWCPLREMLFGVLRDEQVYCLIKIQKKAIRIATNAKYNAHCDPLFAQTDMLKLSDLHRQACIKEAWRAKQVMPNEMGITRSQVKDISKLPVMRTRSLEQDRLAQIQISYVWNELDNGLREKLLLRPQHLVSNTFHTHCILTYKNFTCQKSKCYVCNLPPKNKNGHGFAHGHLEGCLRKRPRAGALRGRSSHCV